MNKKTDSQFNLLLTSAGTSLLETCINNVNDAILITEVESIDEPGPKIIWANEVFYKTTGYEPAEVIGKTPRFLQGPLTDKAALKELRNALEKWEVCRVALLNYKKDGTTFWNEFEVTPIANEDGDYTHFVSVQRDITNRKQFDEKAMERYELALKGANVGIWDWKIPENEIYFSPIWKSMLGYEDTEIKNEFSEWERLLHPDDFEYATSEVAALLNHETDKYAVEFRLKHKDGHYVDVLSEALSVEDIEGKITRLVGIHINITARKQAQRELKHQSTHDKLTGLVNRMEFERRAERLLASVNVHQHEHALCYLDLDQFKLVNDTCGHVAGDELLRQVGSLLQHTIRERDTIARLGGDEFGVLMEHCSVANALRAASAIQDAIEDFQFIWEEQSFRISVSIGLVPIVGSGNTLTNLLKDADAACYMAKDLGRNRIHVYSIDDMDISQRTGEMHWANRIKQALTENRFCLYTQAIELLDTGKATHYELLIRMLDDKGEIIPPGAFLPAAERYNLITQLDRWVIINAFRLLKENSVFLEQLDFVSINLSGQSLSDASFLDFVVQQFHQHELDGKKICFEITETAAISHLNMAENFISKLKKLDCNFALDDFGSGFSSYGYLKNLPVDFLKIDGVFVKDIIEDKIDLAMVKSINEIGQIMGMQTIAEFVENDDIKKMLKKMGVNFAQGYGIHIPQPFVEVLGLHT